MALTQVPIELSSTPGIVDNSNATAITIDSSENVGIGTGVAPGINGSGLSIFDALYPRLTFRNNTTGDSSAATVGTSAYLVGNNFYLNNQEAGILSFGTNATERMRIDASGNVGIGVTPEAWTVFNPVLQIEGGAIAGSSATNFRVFSNTYYDGSYKRIATGAVTQYEQADGVHIWYSNASGSADSTFTPDEHMRIDSSGNLLVGTTNTDPAGTSNNVVGTAIGSSGYLSMTRDGNTVAFFNRKSDDGTVVQFRKDGSVVGSIGANGGLPYFAGASIGLKISGTQIRPCNSTGQNNDNAVDLGKSDTRFKDLYLSGGAYLGGTGSANKLDDYEEGTFTASLGGTTGEPSTLITADVAKYTKVGNKVHFEISFENESTTGYSGGILIRGLPFTSGGGRTVCSAAHYKSTTWDAGKIPIAIMNSTSTQIEFLNIISGSAWEVALHNTAGTARYIWVTGTYKIT